MPRPRKPPALKELEGTDRADRDFGGPDLPPAEDLDPPDSLNGPDAVDAWRLVVDVLGPVRVIARGDVMALTHLCNLHGRCIRLWRAGESPTAAELTQLRMMFGEFGLTPASRSKAGQLKGADGDKDPAEEFFGPQAVND